MCRNNDICRQRQLNHSEMGEGETQNHAAEPHISDIFWLKQLNLKIQVRLGIGFFRRGGGRIWNIDFGVLISKSHFLPPLYMAKKTQRLTDHNTCNRWLGRQQVGRKAGMQARGQAGWHAGLRAGWLAGWPAGWKEYRQAGLNIASLNAGSKSKS